MPGMVCTMWRKLTGFLNKAPIIIKKAPRECEGLFVARNLCYFKNVSIEKMLDTGICSIKLLNWLSSIKTISVAGINLILPSYSPLIMVPYFRMPLFKIIIACVVFIVSRFYYGIKGKRNATI